VSIDHFKTIHGGNFHRVFPTQTKYQVAENESQKIIFNQDHPAHNSNLLWFMRCFNEKHLQTMKLNLQRKEERTSFKPLTPGKTLILKKKDRAKGVSIRNQIIIRLLRFSVG
jgi:hypothetical protein